MFKAKKLIFSHSLPLYLNANKVLAEDVKRLKAQLQEKEEELKRHKTGKAPGKLKPSGGSPG